MLEQQARRLFRVARRRNRLRPRLARRSREAAKAAPRRHQHAPSRLWHVPPRPRRKRSRLRRLRRLLVARPFQGREVLRRRASGVESQGRVPRANPRHQESLLQHGRRAGAEDRRLGRSRDVHVLGEPARAARPVRAAEVVAGFQCAGDLRPPDRRDRGADGDGHRVAGGRRGRLAESVRSSGRQKPADKKSALREKALADTAVQTMLEVFPAEIRDVEEM